MLVVVRPRARDGLAGGHYSVAAMERQRRPLAFWVIAPAIVFLAMTALWVFGGRPAGVVLAFASVLWWGSGLALTLLGVLAISRFRRDPPAPQGPATL